MWRTTVEGVFDVIVVGLDAIGSATAYHLSKQHTKVLGLETFIPAHDKGSSHGESESFGRRISKILPIFRWYYELSSFGMSCESLTLCHIFRVNE
jgi:glycine/D-amino acid oxidase-like deaminating enzyme